MKAVVLAAGEGERFRPLTEHRPKPMLPVANKPLLEHVVESLADAGIEELVFVVGYKRTRIQNHFEDGDDWDVDIEYVRQDTPRGTGDALLQAEPLIDDEFVMVNGDRIVDARLIERLQSCCEESGEACMAITQVEDPTLYGMVSVEGEYVRSIVEKPPAYAVTSKLVNVGAYGFGPEVFSAIRRTERHGELELTGVLSDHLEEYPVRAVRYDGIFLELTHPWDLLAANEGVLGRIGSRIDDDANIHEDATVGDPVAIGADCSVGPGGRILRSTTLGANVRVGVNAVVMNSVVLSDATIGPGTVLMDSVVGEGSSIGPNCTIQGDSTEVVVGEVVHSDVEFGSLIGDFADVAGDVTFAPGTILGNEVDVEGGSYLTGQIPSGSIVRRG